MSMKELRTSSRYPNLPVSKHSPRGHYIHKPNRDARNHPNHRYSNQQRFFKERAPGASSRLPMLHIHSMTSQFAPICQ